MLLAPPFLLPSPPLSLPAARTHLLGGLTRASLAARQHPHCWLMRAPLFSPSRALPSAARSHSQCQLTRALPLLAGTLVPADARTLLPLALSPSPLSPCSSSGSLGGNTAPL
jgi:hypothetical protein